MAVKIVTDSSADLPAQITEELGITVVPLYVRFGSELLRDRVDIFEDDFLRRLQNDPVHPSTTQPTPEDFTGVYWKAGDFYYAVVTTHSERELLTIVRSM